MLREEILPGGGHLSFVLKRGQILRMTDIEGGANVSLLMLNPHEKSERLNLPDTLKGQHTARLTAGHCFTPTWDACWQASPQTPAAGMTVWRRTERRRGD